MTRTNYSKGILHGAHRVRDTPGSRAHLGLRDGRHDVPHDELTSSLSKTGSRGACYPMDRARTILQRIFPRSIRGQLVVAFLPLAFLPIIVIALLSYNAGSRAMNEFIHLHLVSVIEARRTLLTNWLDRRQSEIRMLVQHPGFLELLSEHSSSSSTEMRQQIKGALDWFAASATDFDSILIFDNSWNVIARVEPEGHDETAYATPEFREGLENADGVYIDVVHAHNDTGIGVYVGIVLEDATASDLGYLVFNLDFSESLEPILQNRSGLWDTGKIYIASPDLVILTNPYPGDNIALNETAVASVIECAASPGYQTCRYADYRVHEVVSTALPLGINDWVLVAEIDTAEAFRWSQNLVDQIILASILLLLIITFSVVWLSNGITASFRGLANAAHQIREGSSEVKLKPMRSLEATEVGEAFNQMLTDLQAKQRELIRSETLARVGELTARIVHEMRNPFSSIKMNVQSLGTYADQKEQEAELKAITLRQLDRIERMLSDLLQYGRPIELTRERLTFPAIVNTAIQMAEPNADRLGIGVQVSDNTNELPILADREQLTRAVYNLVLNAIQASDEGDTITVAGAVEDGTMRISVSDTGAGFDMNAQEKLFLPFFTTKESGTGLGLANVRKIIELHDGHIEAKTRPAGGAEFAIFLPLPNRPES